jgi:acyl transferase domain-containing protein
MESIRQNEEYADAHSNLIQDMAYTLATRRDQKLYRTFSVRVDGSSAHLSPVVKSKCAPNLVLVFTGQGAQWAQMGIDLLSKFPSFLQDIEKMQMALMNTPHPPSWSILGS